MHSDLKDLLALQEVDRTILEISEELSALEPELAELDSAVRQLEESQAHAQGNLEDANGRRDELEARIETFRVMQERRRQKLEWVRGAKEASNLMAEIDVARTVLAKEEADWIRSADEVQRIEAVVGDVEQKVAAVIEEQAPRKAEIAGIQEACQERLTEAHGKRAAAAKAVNPPMLVAYERVLRGRAPLAMYELHAQACGHCFTGVPMHLRQQIQRGELVPTCEVCGVIMYSSA